MNSLKIENSFWKKWDFVTILFDDHGLFLVQCSGLITDIGLVIEPGHLSFKSCPLDS